MNLGPPIFNEILFGAPRCTLVIVKGSWRADLKAPRVAQECRPFLVPGARLPYLRVWFRRRKGAERERGRAYISLVRPGRFLIPLRVRQPRR